MKNFSISIVVALVGASAFAAEPPPRPLVEGLKDPTSAAVGAGGKVFVAVAGESGKDGEGAVVAIENDKAVPFAAVPDDLRGLAAYQLQLFVAGRKRVWRIDKTGAADILAAPTHSPRSRNRLRTWRSTRRAARSTSATPATPRASARPSTA